MAVCEPSKNHSRNNRDLRVWRRPLVWLNLVCLDAPLIAIGWQWLFAREFGVALSASAAQALFLTAWLIYASDRFADTIALKPSDERSLRQEFCLRHRTIWLAGILVIAFVDAGIVLMRLEHELFQFGVGLAVLALVYLVINYRFNRVWQIILVKECLVGLLFAAGTLFVSASRMISLTSTFLLMGFLFALLCSFNCISIAVWERALDLKQGKQSIATRLDGADLFARWAPLALSALCVALAFIQPANRSLIVCLAASAFLLSALHFVPLGRDERTALADLVLLTPYVLMFGNPM
jgi:hypothetical protein